jgi:hypothetical protein
MIHQAPEPFSSIVRDTAACPIAVLFRTEADKCPDGILVASGHGDHHSLCEECEFDIIFQSLAKKSHAYTKMVPTNRTCIEPGNFQSNSEASPIRCGGVTFRGNAIILNDNDIGDLSRLAGVNRAGDLERSEALARLYLMPQTTIIVAAERLIHAELTARGLRS